MDGHLTPMALCVLGLQQPSEAGLPTSSFCIEFASNLRVHPISLAKHTFLKKEKRESQKIVSLVEELWLLSLYLTFLFVVVLIVLIAIVVVIIICSFLVLYEMKSRAEQF